ncbi:unnamed protein product [Dicrocoelium dendriticum]|nr:unnamed protein product [Dicrocoelium dendriticum]
MHLSRRVVLTAATMVSEHKSVHATGSMLRKDAVSFGPVERDSLGLTGLLPPIGGRGAEFQGKKGNAFVEAISITRLRQFASDFDRYDWLMNLCDKDKEHFYRLMNKHADYLLPLVYTPTVGQACQNLSLVYNNGRGLFVTIHDKGKIKSILQNWPEKDVRAICVTDGERILGLGDQGAFGLAGIPPQHCLPITLDVGTNNEEHLNSSLYFGLKQKRVNGEEYDAFIDEFMQACASTFGKHVLIQFEDFANHNAFRLLRKYNKTYCTFNDDIQGTASVVLAGILASPKLTGRKLPDEIILCYGSGEAAIGFAHLVTKALTKRYGLTLEEAKKRLFLVDSKGLVVKGRKSGGLNEHKLEFACPAGTPELTSLEEIVRYTKCTTLLGAAATPGAFSPRILQLMAELNETPLIMALSNPTSVAECTAEEAYIHTQGRCVFASGSPFLPVSLEPSQCMGLKKPLKRYPGQANNSYIFPGVALAIVSGQISPVTDDDFLVASETLAAFVSDEDYSLGRLFPPLSDIRRVSVAIAKQIVRAAIPEGRCHAFESSHVNDAQVEQTVSCFSNYPPEE